jgi:5-methylcytosine-specific restriction endonuclease McrA
VAPEDGRDRCAVTSESGRRVRPWPTRNGPVLNAGGASGILIGAVSPAGRPSEAAPRAARRSRVACVSAGRAGTPNGPARHAGRHSRDTSAAVPLARRPSGPARPAGPRLPDAVAAVGRARPPSGHAWAVGGRSSRTQGAFAPRARRPSESAPAAAGSSRGASPQCGSCSSAALPPDERAARDRRYHNTRRARKAGAEIAGPVPAEVYAAVRTSGPCVYCAGTADAVDHVWPLARGGPEHESNLVPACTPCNSSKHDRLLTEWRPDRVARAVACSSTVAAEWARLSSAVAAA